MEMITACGATPTIPSGAPAGGGGTSGSSAWSLVGSPGPLDGTSGGGGGGAAGTVWVIVTGEGGDGGAGGGGGRWSAGGGRARVGRGWPRRWRKGRGAWHWRGHRSALRCSADHRRHDGAVRVAIRESIAAHDVVPAWYYWQPPAGIDAGVDDGYRHPVTG